MCRRMVFLFPIIGLAAFGQASGQNAACSTGQHGWLWLAPAGLFLLSVLLARRYNIAAPNRALLLARTADVKQRAAAAQLDVGRLEAIERRFHGAWNSLRDFFFWARGEENADFKTLHFFELALLETPAVPAQRVQARLDTARQRLALGDDTLGKALAARIDDTCKIPGSDAALRELLIEVQYYLYNASDTGYSTLTCWQNKSIWLMFVGLLMILTLGAAAGHYILFIAGAAGGFLSRLSQQLKRANVPNDYGASWSTLFLSPVLGALSGWFGVLLVSFASEPNFGLLGGLFKQVQWDNPCSSGTLFAAFLLGFSERVFDSIVKKIEDQIDKPPVEPTPTVETRS